jgi:membrane protease subunit HflK
MPYNPWEPGGPKKPDDAKGGLFGGSYLKGKAQKIKGSPLVNNEGKRVVKLIVVMLAGVWCLSGFYTVHPDEKAIVLRFEKYVRTESSGLNYHLPFPIERVQKESVTTIRTTTIGFNDLNRKAEVVRLRGVETQRMNQRLMLTGDENIIDMQFEIQWHIKDLNKYIFNVFDPNKTVKDVSQSVVREIVAVNTLSSILTDGRAKIELDAKNLIQTILDSYGAGIQVVFVQMLSADPPVQVVEAFRDVQNARVDKESSINRADAYENDIIPKTRGVVAGIRNRAEAEAVEIVQAAKSSAKRFAMIYDEYKNAKFVTRRRIYLDTMGEVFKDVQKTVVDDRSGSVKIILPSIGTKADEKTGQDAYASSQRVVRQERPS